MYGFIPGPSSPDMSAWRVRRRYRLSKGGHPQLVLIHYGRGASAPIIPTLAVQPVRSYPLRQVNNEPALFVMGEKAGQKTYPPGHPMHGQPYHPVAQGGMGGGMGGGIGMRDVLAQQNRDMEALERRGRERARGMPPGAGPQSVGVPGGAPGMQQQRPVGGPRLDDDDSADEIDQISTRSLALTRYKRNHELMNEVFMYAALGDPTKTITDRSAAAVTTPYSIFNTEKMEEKITNLETEIEQLKARATERRIASSRCTPLPEMLSESTGGGLMQQAGSDVSILEGMVVM